ncbi:MAG: Rieske 2Fe-2S domain-containing protein [Pyrinomonadaceae bacterium]|nr:Rieske 2Fe-2S domain-containing protein [Pyrinomonadaceae bacterium]
MAETLAQVIDKQDAISAAADALQPAVTDLFKSGGEAGQAVKNFLHGTWLGHPLHPVLTDIPVGAWTTALALDAMEAVSGREEFGSAADAAVAVGLVGALGAAATGITDWSDTEGRGRKVGLVHALLNAGATTLYAGSLVCRRRNSRRVGVGLSMLGFLVSGAAAYLGGHLVFGEKIGVDHTAGQHFPNEYTPVMAEAALPENQLTRVLVRDVPLLLVRRAGQIFALAETCSHLGGPLSEGELIDNTVRCPWHCSRFSLSDGSVVDGPATHPQPCMETRVRDGQIEVRLKRVNPSAWDEIEGM